MSLADDVRVAAKSLCAHRFRSALSLLSIAIGAFAIVLMSSLAQSGFQTLRRGIEELGGARLLMLVPIHARWHVRLLNICADSCSSKWATPTRSKPQRMSGSKCKRMPDRFQQAMSCA